MITILYFAQLRDAVNCDKETLEWNESLGTIHDLKTHLIARGDRWQTAFNNTLLCAQNQQMAQEQQAINDGDEIAFFPPVTGG